MLKFVLPVLIPLALAVPAQGYHVMLDPGHGGVDTGAVYNSTRESDLVLKVATKLKTLLTQNEDFQVSITRQRDQMISLSERVRLAETAKADLFVSLHANAALDPRAKGVEFFFQNNLPADEESLYLASQENQAIIGGKEEVLTTEEPSKKSDIAAILEDLHRQHRIESSLDLTQTLTKVWQADNQPVQATIKQAPFYVISKTSMPAVLIEIGFLSNPKEAKRLLTQEYQNHLAQKIYAALVSYKEKMDKPENKTLN
jgi:N-acetylmuramoyl-L-alanine amidase